MAGYSVTSINMKHGDEFSDTDDTLRYFAGGPRSAWTGKVRQTNSIPSLPFQHVCVHACIYRAASVALERSSYRGLRLLLGQLSLASLRGRLIEYQLRLG